MPEQLWWMRRGGPVSAAAALGSRGASGPQPSAASPTPAREQDLGDPGEVLAVAAVRRARDGEVAVGQAEAVEHAGPDGRQRLERLGRGAHEDRADVAAPAHRPVGVVQAPGEAMHALEVPAARDAHGAGGGQPTTVSAPGRTS